MAVMFVKIKPKEKDREADAALILCLLVPWNVRGEIINDNSVS